MFWHEGPRMGALAVLASALLMVATVSMVPAHKSPLHSGNRQRSARDTGGAILPIDSQSQQQPQIAPAGPLSQIITDCRLANGEQPSPVRGAEVGEPAESQLSPKVMLCLNNCANCVKQWKTGVYNGRNCADDCIQQAAAAAAAAAASTGGPDGEQPLVESMDPDCSLIKYFNATLLAASA